MAKSEEADEEISAAFARSWWKALMDNVCALIDDAAVLAEHGSPGRAQSLLVLAMEELAKARWLYQAAHWEWSAPLGLYGTAARPGRDVCVPDQLRTQRLRHLDKLTSAEQYASGLSGFWNADRRMEYYFPSDLDTFEAAAKHRNADKQAGLYVDRDGATVVSPLAIPAGDVASFLLHAAQCAEMHLIEDHTRQQDADDASQIDSVQHLHWLILPLAHPADFAAYVASLSPGTEGAEDLAHPEDATAAGDGADTSDS